MLLTDIQMDALGEFTNIAAGAAVCYLSNVTEAEIDISTPVFIDIIGDNHSIDTSGTGIGYKLSFAAFEAGYCAFVIKDNYDAFVRLFGASDDNLEAIKKYFQRIMIAAVEPIERLMDRNIAVLLDKDLSNDNNLKFLNENSRFVCSRFDVVIDKNISAEIGFIFPLDVATDIANKFIQDGIELILV